jgi:hypothetical protein
MYTGLKGASSSALHFIAKTPIAGLAAAIAIAGVIVTEDGQVESSEPKAKIEIAEVKAVPATKEINPPKACHSPEKIDRVFNAIMKAENDGSVTGVHPDKISYGPTGLTKIALKDVYSGNNYDEILNTPKLNRWYARLYFEKLLKQFGDTKTAIIAYNIGPTRVAMLLERKCKLPQEYLKRVRSFQIEQ